MPIATKAEPMPHDALIIGGSYAGLSAAQQLVRARRRVLVIDDVATTGATTHAAAQSLLAAGAVQVYALTLARAVRLADHSDPVSGQ